MQSSCTWIWTWTHVNRFLVCVQKHCILMGLNKIEWQSVKACLILKMPHHALCLNGSAMTDSCILSVCVYMCNNESWTVALPLNAPVHTCPPERAITFNWSRSSSRNGWLKITPANSYPGPKAVWTTRTEPWCVCICVVSHIKVIVKY